MPCETLSGTLTDGKWVWSEWHERVDLALCAQTRENMRRSTEQKQLALRNSRARRDQGCLDSIFDDRTRIGRPSSWKSIVVASAASNAPT